MKIWRIYFAVLAAFNLFVGAVMIFNGAQSAAMFGLAGPGGPYAMGLIGVLVGVFGLGFAWAAWKPAPHRNVIALGALSKAIASLVVFYHVYAGNISQDTFAGGMVDLVMALLCAVYLYHTRRAAA